MVNFLIDKHKFGRGAKKSSRRQTKFLLYMVAIELLKEVLTRADISTSRKNLSRALIGLSEDEEVLQMLLGTAVETIDSYLTSGTDNCAFDEPAYKNTFNHDLNTYLKWDQLGKSEDSSPRFRNLLAVVKMSMGQKPMGQQFSQREVLINTLNESVQEFR